MDAIPHGEKFILSLQIVRAISLKSRWILCYNILINCWEQNYKWQTCDIHLANRLFPTEQRPRLDLRDRAGVPIANRALLQPEGLLRRAGLDRGLIPPLQAEITGLAGAAVLMEEERRLIIRRQEGRAGHPMPGTPSWKRRAGESILSG